MALDCKHTHPLQHDGTSQNERFLEALEPGSAPVHQFDLHDWMRFAYHYGARLNYFTANDADNPDGNWQGFMKAEDEIKEWLKDAALVAEEKWLGDDERSRILKRQPKGDYEPHLALFLAFLKLLKFSSDHLNGLTRRHLDFYYSRVLQLSKQPAVPDRVHVLFELAKNAAMETVPAGTLLDGGKDAAGKPLRYVTESEITVNTATVALIKSVYHQQGKSVRYAEMTNSVDGLGTEFKDGKPSWNGFGDDSWPAASLGFALASKVLLMKEGERTITVTLGFKSTGTANLPSEDDYRSQLLVFLSGEKEWLAATGLTIDAIPDKKVKTLSFTVTVDTAQQAIVPYDAKTHGERLNTSLPVMRVLVNAGTPAGYRVYGLLSSAVISEATIEVTVTGARDLTVENDQGPLDPAKPFHPFGPWPKKGSGFYIGSTEIFQKEWQEVSLNIAWKDKPDLVQHYDAYRKDNPNGAQYVASEDYFTVTTQYLNSNSWYPDALGAPDVKLFSTPLTVKREPADQNAEPPAVPPLLMAKGVDINKAVLRNYLVADTTEKAGRRPAISARFEAARFNPGFAGMTTIAANFRPTTKSGFIRLQLGNDHGFFHDLYPKLLTELMMDQAKTKPTYPNAKVPNAPYTPVIAAITIDYTARATNSFAFAATVSRREKYDNFAARTIQLFHEHPFGQAEQHVFLKEQCDFFDNPTAARNITLMPVYAPEGELYIGLKNGQPSGLLNLLLAALEGSEDPLAPTFGKDQHTAWYSLTNNEWQSLNQDFLTGDGTNNLLRPGIVTLNLPASVNASNTVLDADHYWLKVQLPQGVLHTSVCRLAGIHTQAATAVFRDNDNDQAHLATPLAAGTIAKVIDKPPLLKAVSQPYGSFGGALQENDRAYYLRVSERLRHKQRGIAIWDYERLVLQQFPTLHKVKCLSHTFVPTESGDPAYSEMAPGSVSLVVVPDIRNRNLFDPLQPRASQNTLREIEHFLEPLTGLHVNCRAANPDYETVLLDFRVKFYDRYDANAYRNILNEEIVRYLSPWAFGEYSAIHFGGSLFKSVLIRFIEEREYVDFISRFRMYHRIGPNDNNFQDKNRIVAQSARAILVSAPGHMIELIESNKVCNE